MKKYLWVLSVACVFAVIGGACTHTNTESSSQEPAAISYEVKNGGFETGDFQGWTATGEAFSTAGLSDKKVTESNMINNKSGAYYYAKYKEEATGVLVSEPFKISGSGFITFKLGGAMNAALTYVSIVAAESEQEIFRFSNGNFTELQSDVLQAYKADLRTALGKTVKIKIVDNSTANYGYVCFDDFATYYESEPTDSYILAEDIKPANRGTATPSAIKNADFSNGLEGWEVIGEGDSFKRAHISNGKISNKGDHNAVGVLRSSPFLVSGEGLVSYRLGMTKDPTLTYLSIRKSGTNEEIFRTYSDRWQTSHGESTHLYYVDLSQYLGEAVYFEFVDNSRSEWGAISLEAINTVHTSLPASLTDETAFDVRYGFDSKPTFSKMRGMVDTVIEEIEEETLKTTFQKTFYATIDGITNSKLNVDTVLRYYQNGGVFCYTGDIPAMWLRDSSAQVLQYLQFMNEDEDVRKTVRGLLLKQFEFIRRDPYANAFNENGSVWERKFELDSLAYPLWLAKQYYDITGDSELFNKFFLITLDRMMTVLEKERTHSDADYCVYSADLGKGVNTFTNCGLIWSGYRPSDDVCYYKFFIPGNMFIVASLESMVEIFEELGLDETMQTRMATFAASVREAIETYGVYNHPTYGKIYAFEVDGSNADVNSAEGKLLIDVANIPSLISAPWLGYCDVNTQTYLNTRAFALSDDNPYYYEGTYASGIGDPHDMVGSTNNPHKAVPVPWHMSIAMQGLTSTDAAEIERCIQYMTNTTGGTYVMHEAFNANNPNDYSRDWFTWPCSLYAQLVLTKKFNYNLLG